MTLATGIVVEALRAKTGVRVFDWSPGPGPVNASWKFHKGLRSLASAIRIATGRRYGNGVLYTVANAQGGLYYNLLISAAARLRGYRVVMHHQVYSYLHRYDWRMQRMDHWLGRAGTHVVLSDGMEVDFRRRYASQARFFVLPNTIIMLDIEDQAQSGTRESRPFRLGHCSNLSLEKGLADVLETTRELLAREQDVQLVLAGPFVSKREQELVEKAQAEFGERLIYRGPVYGEDKRRFYLDIDVMVFPTRYHNEAQPLVLAEAIAYGRPVVAFDRACIRSLVAKDGGFVINEAESFPQVAADKIAWWMRTPSSWKTAREAVVSRAQVLRSDAADSLSRFVEYVACTPTAGSHADSCVAENGRKQDSKVIP
jgi:glycosyltransferase involved in cell wall biosynthesis